MDLMPSHSKTQFISVTFCCETLHRESNLYRTSLSSPSLFRFTRNGSVICFGNREVLSYQKTYPPPLIRPIASSDQTALGKGRGRGPLLSIPIAEVYEFRGVSNSKQQPPLDRCYTRLQIVHPVAPLPGVEDIVVLVPSRLVCPAEIAKRCCLRRAGCPILNLGKMEQYEPIKVLGEGSFGKVYLMKHCRTRDLVCTKVR